MLLSRSNRIANWSWFVFVLAVLLSIATSANHLFAQSKGSKKKQARTTVTSGVSPGEQSLTNIPLHIGHETKGLVLLDFDGYAYMRRLIVSWKSRWMVREHVCI